MMPKIETEQKNNCGEPQSWSVGSVLVGNSNPLFVILGPCVIESESLVMGVAERVKKVGEDLGIGVIFKSSFDKANRSSASSFRGPGVAEGLRILAKVKAQFGLPILTDVHEDSPLSEVADVVDVLQTPAFLVRQTNFIQRVCQQGVPVNIKKGQFQAPSDMQQVVDKAKAVGNSQVLLCDRGTSFGYHNLVSDMRGLAIMQDTGCPVVFDATHSTQQPSGGEGGKFSSGQRQMIPVLARAAVAVGIAGVFMETHPDPDRALCDGPNMLSLDDLPDLLKKLQAIDFVVKDRS